jgi:hypothetical protein
METASSNKVFAADKVGAVAIPVKECPSPECKSFISISSGGSSPVGPGVPTHQEANVI